VEDGRFQLYRRARMALDQLSDVEQAEMLEKVAQLVAVPPEHWPARDVSRLPGDEPLYLLRVNASLRVILRAVVGAPAEVLDIVRHETLKTFARTGA
jgi:hypothetical protein